LKVSRRLVWWETALGDEIVEQLAAFDVLEHQVSGIRVSIAEIP
jgi:hypothetical protein